jgi:hypothetical protein
MSETNPNDVDHGEATCNACGSDFEDNPSFRFCPICGVDLLRPGVVTVSRDALQNVVEYLYHDERQHWLADPSKDHIYNSLQRLAIEARMELPF